MSILPPAENFFFFFFFFQIYFLLFSYQKTKENNGKIKDFAAARLATIAATRWTGNNLFLRVALAQNFYLFNTTILVNGMSIEYNNDMHIYIYTHVF